MIVHDDDKAELESLTKVQGAGLRLLLTSAYRLGYARGKNMLSIIPSDPFRERKDAPKD